ncbi:14930_t:CDS:2 [Dentiscutata heterogama]|uniref:14930_t:CDS:1 n=1 Tax=Dentiscutata heterogama TaxID=1316150 RepID=A0ACA9M8R0_9GLOM|nr:14930_t:CDS:2 [Dentiscutata heterogama]
MSFLRSIFLNKPSFRLSSSEIPINKIKFDTFIFRRYSQNKQKSIPPPRGSITTHKEFLEKIGRGCGDLADKFRASLLPFQRSSHINLLSKILSEIGLGSSIYRFVARNERCFGVTY